MNDNKIHYRPFVSHHGDLGEASKIWDEMWDLVDRIWPGATFGFECRARGANAFGFQSYAAQEALGIGPTKQYRRGEPRIKWFTWESIFEHLGNSVT